MAKNIRLPEKKKTTTKDKLAQAAAAVAARKAEAQAAAKRTISREQADNRSPASVNRENYLRSQGIDPVRERQEQRAQARRDAARMLMGAASRGASEAASRTAQRPDGRRHAFASVGATAEREMPHQMASAAAPTEQMRQRLVADVNATGRLPSGYRWHQQGDKSIAVQDLAHKPLEGVNSTVLQYHTAAQKANEQYGQQYGQTKAELEDLTASYEYAKQVVERGNADPAYADAHPEYYLLTGDDPNQNLSGYEKLVAQKQAEFDLLDAEFDKVDALRPSAMEGMTVRDSDRMQGVYYQRPSVWNDPILSPVIDTVDGAYQMLTGGQSLKSIAQDEALNGKEGIGFFRGLGAGAVMGGNQLNDTLLGIAENAVDLTGSWLGKKINPNWENPITKLREGNQRLGYAAYGDELENATGAERVLMNVTASGLNSAAHMAMGGMLGKGMGMLGGGSTMPTAMQAARTQGLTGLGNMGSFTLGAMTDAYDRAEADGSPAYMRTIRAIAAGMGSMIANSDNTEKFMQRMGIGTGVDKSGISNFVGSRMYTKWGDTALNWAADTFGDQALSEGTQEVVEKIIDRTLDAGFTGNLLNAEYWDGFAGELGEDFFYGYLSGALYNTMALPNYAPSNQMLDGMVTGQVETSPETMVRWFEQVATDMANPELQAIASQATQEMQYAGDVKEAQTGVVDRMLTAADALVAKQEQQAAVTQAVPEVQEDAEGVSRFDRPMAATVIDSENGNVQVVGFETTQDGKNVVLHTVDEAGNRGTAMAGELTFADETVQELMTADGAKNLSGEGLQSYLTGYAETVDGKSIAPSEYAQAYGMVYRRAAAGMDMAEVIRGSVIPQVMTQSAMQDAYAAGLGAGALKQAQESHGEFLYSVKEENGQKYVEVDTDQDIFAGKNEQEYPRIVRNYIKEHFRGAVIGNENNKAYVDARTGNEYTNPANHKIPQASYNAKMKAGTELDNLMTASNFIQHNEADGRHPEFPGGFDLYEVEFRLAGQVFRGTLNIGIDGKGRRRLYDLTQIRNLANHLRVKQQAAAPAQKQGSVYTISNSQKKVKGVMNRSFTKSAWNNMTRQEQRVAAANMEVVSQLAKRMGATINIVDSIATADGQRANGRYNPQTGQIDIALNADAKAYAYVAMHELTHQLKAEHETSWGTFSGWVQEALTDKGQDFEKLVKYQMDSFGLSREDAAEEVICNTVPAILQDEGTLQKLYQQDKSLFEKVMDWVRSLINDIKTAGKNLSQRSESWRQMSALEGDVGTLQGLYDVMESIMQGDLTGKNSISQSTEQYSISDSFEAEYDSWSKEKKPNQTIKVGTTPDVLNGIGAKKQTVIMRSDDILHALRHKGMTDNIMKQIPQMMENPIIIMKSSNLGDKNNHQPSRVVMYGSVYDENGAPVIAVLELRERQKGGQILDMQLVKNAYGKDNRLDVQIQKSEILYLDPNKNRTNSWLHSLRLQLPSDTINYGSIGSITYPNGFVKMEGVKYEELIGTGKSGGIKYSYAGQTAKTADHDMLAKAREMRNDGMDNETIRKETGWFVGKDGKWRFEMDDSQSRVKLPESNYNELGDLLENSRILEAYPEMANMKVIFQGLEDGQYGQYDAKFDTIDLAYELKTKPKELRYALLHELQHAIQHRERFATGASVAYWQRRIDEGFDTRTAKQKEAEAKAEDALRRVMEEKPEFYHDMMNLRKMLPDVPRGKVDWDTLEQLEDDPIEWQEYDAQRDLLEEKYGVEAMFDFDDLLHDRQKAMRSERSATDLYFATAGEIEARNVEGRADLTAEERREKAPMLGDEDTVFARRETQRIGGDIQYSLRETETMNWEEQVSKAKDMSIPSSATLSLGKSAKLYEEFGMQDMSIGMNLRDFRKTMRTPKGSRSGHNLSESILLRLPDALHDPVAIFDNPNRNCIYVMTKLNDSDGLPIVAVIAKDQNDNIGTPMHQVKSAYGMNDILEYMADHLSEESHYHVYKKENFATRAGSQYIMTAPDYPASGSFKQMIARHPASVKFSLSDYDDTVREGENVLEELLTMTAAHRMTDAEAARVARKVLRAASSEMDLDEATQRIKSIFDYASRSGNKLDMQGLSSEATALAEDMLSQSKTLDMQHEEEVADLRYYLKHNQIALSPEQQKEAASLMGGSYGAYRQALFGRVNLRNSGSALDGAVWEQLHEAAPHLFPLDATSGDQVRLLMEAAEYVQPVYRNENGLDAREAAQWLTHELFKGYMSLSGVQSAAKEQNQLGLKLHQYRQVAERFAKEHKAAFDEAYAKVTKDASNQIALAAEKAERRASKAISEAEADADLRVAKAQADVDKRIADARQQNLADIEAYREAMREKARAWRSEFVTRHRDVERKNRYRAQILRETNQLLKKVEKPTDKQHVQDELTGALTAFLKSLDLGKRSRERSIGDRILRLRNVMQDAANGESGRSFIVDSDMLETMSFMAEQLQGMDSLDQLTADQMEQVRNIVHCAVWTVNKADTAFANQKAIRISSAAGRFLQEAGERKDWKDRGRIVNGARDFLTVGQMDSMHFFDKLGRAAKDMYQSLRDGLDKKTKHRAAAMAYVEEAVNKIPAKVQKELFAGEKATATAYNLSGGTVELTKAQVMELYCLNKREQARGHLYDESVGGIRVGDNDKARAVKVNEGDIEKLTDTLTAEEKALADALQQYMAEECARWGNETSLQLYGYKKFGEKHYYPIRVDPDSVDNNKSQEGQQDNLYAIANMGMTKALKEKANNALYIGDIFDTFCRHVDNMATYNAYAAPIADLVRWYNYRPGDGSSVKKMIQTKWGKDAAEYIPRLIRDLNGEMNRSYSPKGIEKMTSLMKSSSVGRNVRVVIQQPTAILRAGDMIDYRFLVRGMSGLTGKGGRVKLKNAIELSKQHCPIALLKSMGFFETDMGKSLRAAMFDNRSVLDKAKDEGMWLAGKMDEITFGAIWRACEAETRKLKQDLTVGSEAYYGAVGKRMSDIIDYTQVVDTPFHRTQLMRSGDGLTKMATSFMSEPSKTYNMLASAMQRLKDNRHDPVAKRKFCRTISVYALNAIINGAAQSLIDAVRNGDDEDFWEKWGKAMFGDWGSCEKFMDYVRTALDSNVISGLNPLALIPYIKDGLSLIQGYDVSRTDMQSMEKLVQVGTNVGKLVTGENKLSGWGWARQLATAVDSVTGQSFSNALRDTYGFANLLLKSVGLDPISEKTETASTSIGYENLYKAMLDGNAKKWDRVSRKLGKDEKVIDSAMASKFAEAADDRIVAAYTAKQSGKASEYARIRSEFVDEYGEMLGENGLSRAEEIFDKSVATYANEQKGEEAEEEAAVTPLNSKAWSYTEAASVVQGYANGTCSLEDIALVRSEMIADSTAKDPQTTVDTNILKQLKPLYIAAGPAERKRLGEAVKELFGKDDKYLANWLKK